SACSRTSEGSSGGIVLALWNSRWRYEREKSHDPGNRLDCSHPRGSRWGRWFVIFGQAHSRPAERVGLGIICCPAPPHECDRDGRSNTIPIVMGVAKKGAPEKEPVLVA